MILNQANRLVKYCSKADNLLPLILLEPPVITPALSKFSSVQSPQTALRIENTQHDCISSLLKRRSAEPLLIALVHSLHVHESVIAVHGIITGCNCREVEAMPNIEYNGSSPGQVPAVCRRVMV